MPIRRLAILCVHTSPLASLGGEKTGGMNVYVKELAQEFARRGIQVDMFTRRADVVSPEIDVSIDQCARVIHIPAGPPQTLLPEDVYPHRQEFASGVIAYATRHNIHYDLIYAHYWLSGLVATILREVWGTPFVQMFHTLGEMKNRISTSRSARIFPDIRIDSELKLANQADRIIAATPAEQAQLRWLYRTPRQKISIIPPGVNTSIFSPIPSESARSLLGLPSRMKHFLYAGRIEPLKAVDTILYALSYIKNQSPDLLSDLRFTVIGGDLRHANPELLSLQLLTKKLGLEKHVSYVGAKSQAELPAYYSASLAVIMPSDYESFGMVALEAMACGTPVIATQVGGLAYLVREQETGFLVPVRDPDALAQRMMWLIRNPETASKMGGNAAQLAQNYTWAAIADQLLSNFDDLLNRRMSWVYQQR